VKSNDEVWRKLKSQIERVGNMHARVGIFSDKGGSADHDGSTILEIAAVHEFGSPKNNIPERSFIRSTFDKKEKELTRVVAGLSNKVMEMKMSFEKAYDILGTWGAGQVKASVQSGPHLPPPLKPATIARKKSTRPLIDTGRMIGAVTHEVKK
jgi:hypothetical protein